MWVGVLVTDLYIQLAVDNEVCTNNCFNKEIHRQAFQLLLNPINPYQLESNVHGEMNTLKFIVSSKVL